MVESKWNKKKQNNLIVGAVLLATLLAVFWAGGEWRGVIQSLVKRLSRPAVVRWEKSNTEELSADWRRRTEDTEKKILDLVEGLQGTYGVYVEDLGTEVSFGINENRVFPAASLIKLPVFVAVYREVEKGKISLNTKYQILNTDKVPGAGSIYYAEPGTLYTYQEMLELMGKQSDNTAFNVFVNLLGEEKIQGVIDGLGMKDTSFVKNETTPRDVGRFFRKMYGGDEGDGGYEGDQGYQEKILDHLTDTIFEDRIPAGIPEGVRVAHKVGTELGVVSDAGIVFSERPFVLVIMSEGIKEAEAKEILPKIAKLIYADLETD